MTRAVQVFVLWIAVVACASSVRAQDYDSVVVFGDSLSDSGNIAALLGLPPGTVFTTNPDPVWAEIVARTFGDPGMHSGAGGTNHAFGGACVDPDGACNYPVPKIGQQIDMHLSGRPSGAADPAALYAIWGGGNDLETVLSPDEGIARVDPRTAVPASARALAAHVRRLREAGARHIVVFNLPDLGKTPFALQAGDPRVRAALTGFSALYNRELDEGLRSLGSGIVPVDAFGLLDEFLRDPAAYGFTDVEGTACTPVGPALNALACGPAGSGAPLTWGPGANRTHPFADARHPAGAAHEMIASAVVATLAAPVQVSLAGEAGVAAVALHRRTVSAERSPEADPDRPVGSWRGYASTRLGRQAVDAPPRLGGAQTELRAVTLGAEHRAADDFRWGAAVTLGRHENGVDGADLGGDTVVASVHGTWRRGGLRLNGALNLGRSQVEIERSIRFGPTLRSERGSTSASLFGIDAGLGWAVHETEALRHGATLGLSWLNQQVEGYREGSGSSTAMNFSGFERGSLALRGGYRIAGSLDLDGVSVNPYAGIFHEREFEDDPISVTAGSNAMAGRFTASGFAPPRQWVGVDLGVSASVDGLTRVVLGYAGRFGDRGREDHLLNTGLRIAF